MTDGGGLPAEAEDPRFWDRLLDLIEEERIVPVIGPDLLSVEADGKRTFLYPLLAEKLAARLGVTPEPEAHPSLHETACLYLAQNGSAAGIEVYENLKSVLTSLMASGQIQPPEPLRQLARIRPLKLFLTTTFDPLLAEALRAAGRPARTFAFSPQEPGDLTEKLDQIQGPVVFHLFGKISAVPSYAVTEEDALEVFHALQSDSRPKNLLKELANRQILLVGNRFPDWLARFFLRIAHGKPLWQTRGRTDVVADEQTCGDPAFIAFVQRFSARTQIYRGSAVELVVELARRWEERHPPDSPGNGVVPPGPLDMKPGSVFLNYAREDHKKVEALARALDRAGVDVWLDRTDLAGGDEYTRKIRRNVEVCSLFVPVLSPRVHTSDRRFFRLEWEWAEEVASKAPRTLRYLVPIALEGLSPDDPEIPESFRRIHWLRMEGHEPSPDLVETLKGYFRAYQKAMQVLR
jgi:hypothetical protein